MAENVKNTPKQPKKKLTWQQELTMYLHDFVYLFAVLIVAFILVFRLINVDGDSMYKTLVDGDTLLILSNTFYREPEQGDVVVISKKSFQDGAAIVKRVIATEGQIVDIDFENAIVYVDGLPIDEPYIYTPTTVYEGMAFPVLVEKGTVFVMGDHRQVSLDSRSPAIGLVDTREILGKALLLMIPGTDHGQSPRDFSRIGAIK